ncbi:MAG: homogentisate 1,2-dioxygenase [Polyangiaceae bacterium]|nr:homogentisate 1,2-dioxygenase [Polyangiaceae bacterium]
MIDRQTRGRTPDKPHTVFRDGNGDLFFEEMFTLEGFAGGFSYFYHRYATTLQMASRISARSFPTPEPVSRGDVDPHNLPLKRRLYDSTKMAGEGDLFSARRPLFFNKDVAVYFASATQSMEHVFANGDGDELWFIQEGKGTLLSPCGVLPFVEGDYVWIPRSLHHQWFLETPVRALLCEASRGIHVPRQFRSELGQLLMDAPYTHRDFVRPNFTEAPRETAPCELVIKKRGLFSAYDLPHAPWDLVGWDGFIYPWAFNIEKYQPKTGLIHLPPTIHATFAGQGFLVCSFVPRVVDYHPQAIPCPYPHSSVDCDEIILYLRGNFTSREGVGPGSISLHPAGIPHGPHPGAYEKSIGSKTTSELAVMLDTFDPLIATPFAGTLERPTYHDSWMKGTSLPPPAK